MAFEAAGLFLEEFVTARKRQYIRYLGFVRGFGRISVGIAWDPHLFQKNHAFFFHVEKFLDLLVNKALASRSVAPLHLQNNAHPWMIYPNILVVFK